MEESRTTIKRVYDQYEVSDFNFGTEESTNLNPKREISLDNLDRIVAKLQEVTDDIVRKKIIPKEPEDEIITANFGADSPAQGIPLAKQELLAATGGVGNALLFPVIADGMDLGPLDKVIEEMIGTFPLAILLDQLDGPPQLDCELVLQQYEFEDDDDDDNQSAANQKSGGSKSPTGKGGANGQNDDDDDDDDDGDGEKQEQETEEEKDENDGGVKDCAEIELTWLKIILILVKIIKIFKIILDLVLSILLPILQIVILAVGAWINPPNIPMIIQIIIELVTAIIVMLITMVLQLIWNLLNLDCICDMTASIIEQIQRALAMFAQIAGAFDPTAIGLMMDNAAKQVLDPLQQVMDTMNKKKEDWAKFTQDMKDMTKPENLKKLKDKMASEIKAGVVSGVMADPNVGKAKALYESATEMVKDSLETIRAVKKTINAWRNSPENAVKPVKERWAAMIQSPSFQGLTAQPAPKKD